MMRRGRKAVVIPNASDEIDDDVRRNFINNGQWYNQIDAFYQMGIDASELDLKDFFGKPDKLRQALKGIDLVWVMGGNSFVLRNAMKRSGFDHILPELLKSDTFVYGGFSAGVVVLTPTLHGAELVDNANAKPELYSHEIIWDGMNLIPFCFVPHYKSDHPESLLVEKMVDYYEDLGISYKTLRDGGVILIENGVSTVKDRPLVGFER